MAGTALLVVDLQNDFIEEDSVYGNISIRKNLKRIKSFIDACREKGFLIIYTRHCFSPKKNPIEARLYPELIGEVLKKGTHGWNIHESIYTEDDIIIDKHRYDAFYGTDLESILKKKRIKNIIIIGTMTNVCCDSTARGAMYRDFNVFFCSDLNFTYDKRTHKMSLENINDHFGEVLSSKEILRKLI
ncbi:cysteine hydrolase [Candidatus Woesearchaeota archaeon]|nr:cysteine hydrolase [Candidatus Woesearchaeota archaeon]